MRTRTRRPRIQLCTTCGQMQVFHERGYYNCSVPVQVTAALQKFKSAEGRRWKSALRAHWERACCDISDLQDRALLQQARNLIGPSRLDKITLD